MDVVKKDATLNADKMNNLNLVPFVGAGPYLLGQTFEAINATLPEDIRVIENSRGIRVIDGAVSMKFVDDRLAEFSVLDTQPVCLEGLDLFSNSSVDELKRTYRPLYRYGFLIFDELGIALAGFEEEEEEEQKAITVYRKGSWDHILQQETGRSGEKNG